jgi:hypothetical protein
MKELFGYHGTNTMTTNLLERSIIPPECELENEYVQMLVGKLSSGKVVEISDDISFEEFKEALDTWSEKTTTSPSGRHLGHYKLLTRLIVHDKIDKNINISEKLLKVYYNIAMSAAYIGSPLQRWKNITTCMIEKAPGVSRLDKLRVIHIFEADYNLILKVMWSRKAVWDIHHKGLLNNGQSGSRPGCRAIDVAIQKEMNYTYAKLTRTPLITVDNDAKSCFDRILCNVAMMVSQYFGITNRMCKLQSTNLMESKFTIRTARGDSNEQYQHSDESPIHGTGQGSCASPAIWLLIKQLYYGFIRRTCKWYGTP